MKDKKGNDILEEQSSHDCTNEWWYVNGHLSDEKNKFGYCVVFFKFNLKNFNLKKLGRKYEIILKRLPFRYLYVLHSSIIDKTGKKRFFKLSKTFYIPGLVQAKKGSLSVKYPYGSLKPSQEGYALKLNYKRFSLDLNLEKNKDFVTTENGKIDMGCLGESYYRAIPRFSADGRLVFENKPYSVKGTSYLEHQWGEWDATRDKWRYLSVQLDDGTDIAFFLLTEKEKWFAILTDSKGNVDIIKDLKVKHSKFWKSPETGKMYPISWKVSFANGSKKVTLSVEPYMDEQETIDLGAVYWEGACKVKAVVGKKEIPGEAYMELVEV